MKVKETTKMNGILYYVIARKDEEKANNVS